MTLTAQPPRVPLGTVNGQPVLISREWWVYLAQELFTRVGGANGTDMGEIQRQIEALTLLYDELGAQFTGLDEQFDEFEQEQGQEPVALNTPVPDSIDQELSGLREEVAELTKAVQALQAGTTP